MGFLELKSPQTLNPKRSLAGLPRFSRDLGFGIGVGIISNTILKGSCIMRVFRQIP